MAQQVPQHILNLFSRESLVHLLNELSPLVGYEVDTDKLCEVSKEDLLLDLSWLINQVGEDKFVEVMINNLNIKVGDQVVH